MQHIPNDRTYYMRREQQCRALARNAANPSIRKLHTDFADRYARLLRGMDPHEDLIAPAILPAANQTAAE